MKTIKRFLILTVFLFAIPTSFIYANDEKTFDHYIPMDIDFDHWAFYEIDDFINADIVEGYMDKNMDMTIEPESHITKAEFLKLLITALGLDRESDSNPKVFTDVKEENWYYKYVNIASSLGIVNGRGDGSFGANENITRDEATSMIVRAYHSTIEFPNVTKPLFKDVDSKHWAYNEINKAAQVGIVNGVTDSLFKPKNSLTRAQAIVILHRSMHMETLNLPSEQELITFIENYEKTANRYLVEKDFSKLLAHIQTNSTGYYHLLGTETFIGMDIEEMEENGFQINISVDDSNLGVEVLEQSSRLALVYIDGYSWTVSGKSSEESFESTRPLSGYYQLIKDQTGEWKIFNSFE